jgi:hypothetical protein
MDSPVSAFLTRWSALLAAVALACAGCSHIQRPEPQIYVISEEASGIGGSGSADWCAEEQIRCFDRCWNKAPPLTTIKKGSGKHHEYCTETCLEEYMECIKKEEKQEEKQKQELHFTSTDKALEWLRSHKTEIAVGTVVIIAGASFVVATGGSGALILVPLAPLAL